MGKERKDSKGPKENGIRQELENSSPSKKYSRREMIKYGGLVLVQHYTEQLGDSLEKDIN